MMDFDRLRAITILALALCPLFGCFRDPDAVQKATALERRALMQYDANMNAAAEIVEDVFRQEALAHLKTVWAQNLDLLKAKADPGTGKIDAATAVQFVKELDLLTVSKAQVVDGRVATMRAARAEARKDLLSALKLAESLDQFHKAGMNPEIITKIVDTLGKAVAK